MKYLTNNTKCPFTYREIVVKPGESFILNDDGSFVKDISDNGETLANAVAELKEELKAATDKLSKLTDEQISEVKSLIDKNDKDTKEAIDKTKEEMSNKDVYSTSEVKTNKVWTDGRPIYRKVVNFGKLPTTNSTVQMSINIPNLRQFTQAYGFANGSDVYRVIPYVSTGSSGAVMLNISNKSITLFSQADLSKLSAQIVLEYTKTTD